MSLKAARQQALAALLRTRQVSSQARVLEHLRGQGFDATQATISRDLDDLGAVKVRGPDGRLVYALPEADGGQGAGQDEVRRMLGALLLAIVPSGNLVVLRTPPGHAGALASTLDRAGVAGVAGTIAGDDTVLVVCTERTPGRVVARQLAALAQSHPEATAFGLRLPDPPGHPLGVPRTPPDSPGHPLGVPRTPPPALPEPSRGATA